MKKIAIVVALFIAGSAFTVFTDASKDIVGKWKTAESSYPAARKVLIERIRKASPEQAEQLEALGEQLNEMIGMITYEYKENGDYEIITPQGPQGGKWKITTDGKYLEKQASAGGAPRKDSIIEIKPAKLVLMNMDIKEKLEYVKAD